MVQFAPNFLEWPLAVCQEMSKRHDSFSAMGLVTGRRWVHERVQEFKDVKVDPVDYLDNIERRWIASDLDMETLKKYEAKLGTEALNKLVISDRHLGHGFITGGIFPKTWLIDCINDSENLRKYIVGLLSHLEHRLTTQRPDVVFCYAVAGAPAYALFILCEHLGIPFRRLGFSRIGNRRLLESNVKNVLTDVEHSYRNHDFDNDGSNYIDEAKKILIEFRNRPSRTEYAERLIKQYNRTRGLKKLPLLLTKDTLSFAKSTAFRRKNHGRTPSPWSRFKMVASGRVRSVFDVKKISQFEGGDYPRRFVYYPLHHDPEASTMVMAPNFTDQLAVVEAIAKSMPLDMELVVKEHVPMIGYRPKGFYDCIANMPRVSLVNPLTSPYELINKSSLVCTITGTAATEALLLEKPVLIFSDAPFTCINKGFVQCDELTSLSQKIKEALVVEKPDDDTLIRYIASILMNSFVIPSEKLWKASKKKVLEGDETFVRLICEQLERAIRSPSPLVHSA